MRLSEELKQVTALQDQLSAAAQTISNQKNQIQGLEKSLAAEREHLAVAVISLLLLPILCMISAARIDHCNAINFRKGSSLPLHQMKSSSLRSKRSH